MDTRVERVCMGREVCNEDCQRLIDRHMANGSVEELSKDERRLE